MLLLKCFRLLFIQFKLQFIAHLDGAFCLFLFVVRHVVVGAFIPLDVDFERVKSIADWGGDALLKDTDRLLVEELLDARLSDLRIVCLAVALEAAAHVVEIVVGAFESLFRQLLNAIDEILVGARQQDAALGEDFLILVVLGEILLAFLIIIIIVFVDSDAVLVHHFRLHQEAVLRVLECAWVSIEYVTTVAARILL